jgi:hypothetical protein
VIVKQIEVRHDREPEHLKSRTALFDQLRRDPHADRDLLGHFQVPDAPVRLKADVPLRFTDARSRCEIATLTIAAPST